MTGTIGGVGYETVLLASCEGTVNRLTANCPTRTVNSDKAKEEGDVTWKLPCREIKRATAGGRIFCGIQTRRSF